MTQPFQVTFDANDTARLAEFWAFALDYELQPPPPGFDTWEDFARDRNIPEDRWDALAAIVDPVGEGPRVLFQKVPEQKTAKNRVHLDVNASAGIADPDERHRAVERKVRELEAEGATLLERFDEPTGYWVVMTDPEGNEFCVQ